MSRYRPPKPVVSSRALLTYLRGSRLIICEHDDSLWVTDSYLLVRLDDDKTLGPLLADYNLPLEPMVCRVATTIVRVETSVPEIAKIVPALKGMKPMVRETVGGSPALVEASGTCCSVWRSPAGLLVTLSEAKRKLVEALTPSNEWRCGDKGGQPVVRANGNRVAGLLVPVRSLLNENNREAVA